MVNLRFNQKKIFFSYTMRDCVVDKKLMEEINTRLSPSFDIFIDLIHNDSECKQERVLFELRNSQYLIVINTPLVEKSIWVRTEIDEARRLNIPVFYTELMEHNDLKKNSEDIVQYVIEMVNVADG